MKEEIQTTIAKDSYLISFEGIEGSGKSTQITLLKNHLESHGYETLVLREPGGTVFGEELRKAILMSDSSISPIAEAHLFAASRAQLLTEKVLPFLQTGKRIVILDRFIDSSMAYQGFARGLGPDKILSLHNDFPLSLRPTITFYLRINLETSMQRQDNRGQKKDYFEKENNQFYTTLIEGYDYCSKHFKNRIKTIDASSDVEEVAKNILNQMDLII